MSIFLKVFLIILTIIWLVVIFILSSYNAKDSSKLSDKVLKSGASKIISNKKTLKKVVNSLGLPIRKIAHFIEYMFLGILVYLVSLSFNLTDPFMVLVICLILACLDEIHQFFVPDRTCRILDIIIDVLGTGLGVLIVYLIK